MLLSSLSDFAVSLLISRLNPQPLPLRQYSLALGLSLPPSIFPLLWISVYFALMIRVRFNNHRKRVEIRS